MTERWARIEPLLGVVPGCGRDLDRRHPPAAAVAHGRPAAEPLGVRALRTHQWIEHDGSRREVMPLDDDVRLASLGDEPAVVPAGTVGA